ncbi:hypothetical protein MUP59_09435 [Candidatus Bathyarchaeota archaeon]|nr:hypothetical protein [Candidatus Bathyarchaeota archaeon]
MFEAQISDLYEMEHYRDAGMLNANTYFLLTMASAFDSYICREGLEAINLYDRLKKQVLKPMGTYREQSMIPVRDSPF